MDWRRWHEDYDDSASALGQRLAVVQGLLASALDRTHEGAIRLISICAGEGRDVIGVLADHSRARDVSALLFEFDQDCVRAARTAVTAASLTGVSILAVDASLTDAYEPAVPADIIMLCGVFGNISDRDIANTIHRLPRLAASGAQVIWTRHRHPPDVTSAIRADFAASGFEELAFETPPAFGVGANRLVAEPLPFAPGRKLFEFVGFDVLAPEFHATQIAAQRS